jgi:pyrroloquinoline quinone biosynthesis protein D
VKLGLRSKARLVRRRPGGEPLLLYPERALALNESAAEIVSLLDGTRSEHEISALLAARHPDAPPAEIRADVKSVLAELESRALLARAS